MLPLVPLPGMMCDARLFGPQIDAFSARHTLHFAPIGGHATMQDLAAEVLANVPPTFALLGLSMGGIVAMEILRQAPDRVAKLALLDTNPLAETDEAKHRRGPQIDAAKSGHLARVMRDDMKPNYLADTARRGAILDLCMDMALGLGPDVFINQSKALMARPDQTETLKAYTKPTLILCGEHDILCPVSRHEMMASLMPQASLRIIPKAGHLPTLEEPGATNAALTDWLETQI